ncbi:MAG: C_GCAxxG_C_C family protein [Phycisphaerae bacterium]|nr:C_GCAxxG_C_C family protein [Phycisphaerae bacterium]
MKRRDFLKVTVSGSVVAGSFAQKAPARERQPSDTKIDAEALARESLRHFLPGKKLCSEAILAAGCEALGIKSELVPDIALGLAGGLGRQGKTCGCVTASAMVLGLAVAARESDRQKKMERTLEAAARLCRRFEKTHGTTVCRKICGLDLTTPEGQERMKTVVKATKCHKIVEATAKMLAEEIQKA